MRLTIRKPFFGFPTWSNTNQAGHLQKIAKGLKFCIHKQERLYYLDREKKQTC